MMYETFEETVHPGHTALLVTDVQNDFCKDEPRQAMIRHIARIVEAARKFGVMVVYIQNTVLPDSLSDAPSDVMRRRKLGINTEVTIEGTWGHQIVDQLKPGPKEPVVRKHRLSAFIGTTLDIMLRSKAIQTVVVTGTATHGCVINTAYGAIAHNYYVIVVEDGVASWRKDLHDSALFLMRNTINYVVDADKLIATWQQHSAADRRHASRDDRTSKMTQLTNSPASDSQLNYSDLVQTNPGTLAGRFMRMFWQPVYRSQDIAAGRTMPIKIMGEDFTLYRGEGGVAHVLAQRCAHRRTQLSVGWVEGDCIRCFYHGWKYDSLGQCVEQPAEDASFAAKIRIRSYPTQEYLGLIFAYLGEASPPPLPRFPELEGEGVIENYTFVRACNFFRHLELDPAHIAFVHRDSPEAESGLTGIPTIECQETDYGFVFYARRDDKVQTQHRLMPNASYFKVFPMDAESGWRDRVAWRVPVDNEHYVSFIADLVHVTGEAAQRYKERHTAGGKKTGTSIPDLVEAVLAGKLRIEDVKDLGANVVFFQDEVALLAQGDIGSHNTEELGSADSLVSLQRQLWMRELSALAKGRPLKQWTRPLELIATTGV